ncbi:DJ-1/PfpI family protein [Actinoalloteichus sp. AHMU CJ021]|uniref:DJ-1/PfpI family protein n=1 Tax=Actinoalloteichus caeruleus DSM 43889 TaxID=1120930 RepID=A0ABT1JKL9_ACTCY|nr:DJ-1/PfpI family protein [Actinoalloteichus caeruleus]AUS78728.1 DJ-1/PfpI family protein [Actinoalloteichus sp. AHMU CJ021]MCP2332882.1 DJ-1/PfpI family protein [Actinoalloteichus caeruleus DSM 43889]
MRAAFVLYENMTALDLIGPYEVLAGHPELTTHFVAERTGPVACDSGAVLHADTTLAELPDPDVIVVPGSGHWRPALENDALIAWLAAAHPTARWTTSVCTGSTLLAAAGLLTGRPATTHWAVRGTLAELGAEVVTDRVVVDGNTITAAGVSAGIDMGLLLARELWGGRMADTIQLAIEYAPETPGDAGSPETADPDLVTTVRALINR